MAIKHTVSSALLGATMAASSPQVSPHASDIMDNTRREYAELMIENPSQVTIAGANSEHGAGLRIEATKDAGDLAFGLRLEAYNDMKRALGIFGYRFHEQLDGIITVSYAGVDAASALNDDRFSGNLHASSIGAGVFYHADTATAFARLLQEKGNNTQNLYEGATTTTEITVQDFATFIRETITETTAYESYAWRGITRNRGTVGGIFQAGDNHEFKVEAGASKDPLYGTKEYGRGEYSYYGGTYRLGVNAETGINPRYGATIEYQMTPYIGLVGGVEHLAEKHGRPSDTIVHAGVRVNFDAVNRDTRHTRSGLGQQTLYGLVRSELNNSSNIANPASLGSIEINRRTGINTTENDTLKPAENISGLEYDIDANGVVSFRFTPRAGWEYAYQLQGTANNTPWTSAGNGNFQVGPLAPGQYTLVVREINPMDRNLTADTQISFMLAADQETVITDNIVIVGVDHASINLSLFDADGIENYTCQLADANGNRIGNAFAPTGQICEVTGLTPSTRYIMIETARVARVLPNGSVTWEQKEKRTSFETLEAPDNTPPSITLRGNTHIVITQ